MSDPSDKPEEKWEIIERFALCKACHPPKDEKSPIGLAGWLTVNHTCDLYKNMYAQKLFSTYRLTVSSPGASGRIFNLDAEGFDE